MIDRGGAVAYHRGMTHRCRARWFARLPMAVAAAALAAAAFAVPSDPDEAPLRCLAQTIYWEAKGEAHDGMVAVGWVVLNRLESPEFPDSLCGVVYQGGETPPCQFSWWCDGRSDRPREQDRWALAQQVAERLLRNPPADPTDGALFFHHAGIDTPWQLERTRTARIGAHVFYR